MKKIFTIIALAILILVSFVAIAVSFSSLSKNEKENKILNTQIQQNVELKERLVEIEHTIVAYDEKTNELNKISERLGTEEKRLQDEKTALDGIKEELDEESKDIKKKEEKLGKEYKRLIEVDASLTKAEKQLSAEETAWKKEKTLNERNSNVQDANGHIPDPQPSTQDTQNQQAQDKGGRNTSSKKTEDAKQKELKALQTRRANLNVAKTKQENAWKTYQKDAKDLDNSKREHEIKESNYNIRHTRYGNDRFEFNQKNNDFTRDQTEHDGRSVEIQKLREKKAKIEQKISSFEKENPDIQAKCDEFQKTKSYLRMIVATFSFLLLILIILLVFVIVFKGVNRSQRPKTKATEKTETKPNTHDVNVNPATGYIYKPKKTMENNEVKENSKGFFSWLFNGKKSHTKESEYGASKQTQNISVDDIIGLKNYISNFEKRLRQLENDHISTETGTSQENNKLDAVLSKIAGIDSKLDDFDERLKKIEENEGYNSFTTKPYEQTIAQSRKSRYHTYEENESLYKNSPPQGALVDEYSDSIAREKYKYTQGKIYLDVNKDYTQGRMESQDASNSIFKKNGLSERSLFVLIEKRLYFNFYRYNENKELPDTENESVMMEEIFNFRKDKYGRIKWCSPAIVELKNGNYVVEDKGSVWIEK